MIINKSHIEDVIYGKKRSLFIGPFLRLASIVYGLLLLIRQGLFRVGILRARKLAQQVISVGNLTLGGTGKTPAVMNIAKVLLKQHKKPVVVSRGYGRNDESSILVVSDGKDVYADAKTGGDEPVLMGLKLLNVPVVVGSDRYCTASFAYEKFGNDTVILDDGFQHLRLRRDIDIVLINAADPFGNNKLFPAGILREPPAALRRADVVLITGSDGAQDLASLKRTIEQNTDAKIFTSRHAPIDLIEIMSGEIKPLSTLRGMNLLAISGIASPESFLSLLRSLGGEIRTEIAYPDHYEYTKSDLAALFQRAADEKIGLIVTTEKDAVRLKNLKPAGIWALRIELKVVENDEWETVLSKS